MARADRALGRFVRSGADWDIDTRRSGFNCARRCDHRRKRRSRNGGSQTPADHQALASYFSAKANEAQANVEKHRRMSGLFGGKGKSSWEGHCHSLMRTYEEQAKDYAALAKEQNAVATALSK